MEIKGNKTITVTSEMTAKEVGSGELSVYATPAMIALMEKTAYMSVADSLGEGQGTVGTRMDVKHLSATPIGMDVICETELIEQDGRRLVFKVQAFDKCGLVGEGTHERFIIDNDRFMEKAEEKKVQTDIQTKRKAILLISFGSSYKETCEKNIDPLAEMIRKSYPEYSLYQAWSSNIIRRKIEKRDQIHIDSIQEAMERMRTDGVEDVIVQPTHIINGIETAEMERIVLKKKEKFHSISIGKPLLTSQEDCERVIEILGKEWKLLKDELLVLMGHGTEHYANFVYPALNYQLSEAGINNIILGTVEGYPTIENVVSMVKKRKPGKVILAPFMFVAGDHATNDMAGDEEDSWKNRLGREGYETECVIRGLGEYEGIRELFLEHIKKASMQNKS